MPDRSLIRNRAGLARGRVPEGRRVLDLAEGILIGLRRYTVGAAFDELMTVAHRHSISITAASCALVDLASGASDAADFPSVEATIAQLEWGSLLSPACEASEIHD